METHRTPRCFWIDFSEHWCIMWQKILVCKIDRKWNVERIISPFCFSSAYFFDTPRIKVKISTFEIFRVHKFPLTLSFFTAYQRCEKMSILWKIDKIALIFWRAYTAIFTWFVQITLLSGFAPRMGFKRPRVRISTLGPTNTVVSKEITVFL